MYVNCDKILTHTKDFEILTLILTFWHIKKRTHHHSKLLYALYMGYWYWWCPIFWWVQVSLHLLLTSDV